MAAQFICIRVSLFLPNLERFDCFWLLSPKYVILRWHAAAISLRSARKVRDFRSKSSNGIGKMLTSFEVAAKDWRKLIDAKYALLRACSSGGIVDIGRARISFGPEIMTGQGPPTHCLLRFIFPIKSRLMLCSRCFAPFQRHYLSISVTVSSNLPGKVWRRRKVKRFIETAGRKKPKIIVMQKVQRNAMIFRYYVRSFKRALFWPMINWCSHRTYFTFLMSAWFHISVGHSSRFFGTNLQFISS